MFKRITGITNPLSKSKNPHSLENLRYLQGVLVKNEKITDANKANVIEALRSITEILIWGDQNDNSVFDVFLEKQMLVHFVEIMRQKCGTSVNVQLLQTLNILFENIRHETSLYFLLSNNHVNSIITHPFDFENEEIIAYYISFLKTLSFKINPNTVHFFYSDTANEFPLFTEAIRFYNHRESMVRIAVRTLTLNLFRAKNEGVQKFLVDKSSAYFSNVCEGIAAQIIEMDTFARSAQNEASNRSRLMGMIDEHLDHLHYINDILEIGNAQLNRCLFESFDMHIFSSIYLSSLALLRRSENTVLISRVSALFLLTQFLRIIHETQTVQNLLTTLFFGDQNDIRREWVRTIDRGIHLTPTVDDGGKHSHIEERLFFYAHLKALSESHDDHTCFYSLLLICSIVQNKGVPSELLEAAQFPYVDKSNKCDTQLANNIIRIIENCSFPETAIRGVTLELTCHVLRQLLQALEHDSLFNAAIEDATKRSIQRLLSSLRPFVSSEKLFLEMFEDEFFQLEKNPLHLEKSMEDASLYLPPSNTPLSNVVLSKRLPCGNDERIRRALQFYFILRKLAHDLAGKSETQLPLSAKVQIVAELDDCINLNNCDLVACTVVLGKNEKFSRFLVTDQCQLILVEPDKTKLSWGIVRFVGPLQDTQMTGDSSDNRILHIVVDDVKSRAAPNAKPMLRAQFVFDDKIRCLAAKQRLNTGRKNSRLLKLNSICDLFGIPHISPSREKHKTSADSVSHSQTSSPHPSSSSSPSPGRPIPSSISGGPGRALREGAAISRGAQKQQEANSVAIIAQSAGTFFQPPIESLIRNASPQQQQTTNTAASSSSTLIPDDPLPRSSTTSPRRKTTESGRIQHI